MNKNKKMIFISCGQFTKEEKRLGKKIKKLVEDLTDYEAYFAETATSLDSLTSKIFNMLNEASGFISVMHHRGAVSATVSSESTIRGSLWIEQEIAIAAFIREILNKNIESISFVQKEINLEGVRQYIHLNSKSFQKNNDIIKELKKILPNWNLVDRPSNHRPRQEGAESTVSNILNELKHNIKVARTQKPWTAYLIDNRGVIASLENLIGGEAADKISELYVELEAKNYSIGSVRPGYWSDQYRKKYYDDLIKPIQEVINLISEKLRPLSQIKSTPEVRRVGLNYPEKSGLKKELETQGYDLHWSRKDMDVESEPVIIDQPDGGRIMFKDEQGTLTLLRKKKPLRGAFQA